MELDQVPQVGQGNVENKPEVRSRIWVGAGFKAMATHSSTLAWKIPWMQEPGGLQSMGLLRVGHNLATSLSLFTFMHWRMKWQPTPVFLPGESQGQGSLVGCRLWGRTESDTTEVTQHTLSHQRAQTGLEGLSTCLFLSLSSLFHSPSFSPHTRE